MLDLIRTVSAGLFPGYFALVMATGIVSIAAAQFGVPAVAWSLVVVNVAAYLILWVLTLARVLWSCSRLAADLSNHARGPGLFTLVAGTCVLGMQFLVVAGIPRIAAALWFLSMPLWIAIVYGFFFTIITRAEKPNMDDGLHGGWLLACVATQAIAVLGASLAASFTDPAAALFLALAMHLLGCTLYGAIIVLIIERLVFGQIAAAAWTPPYWINMGAAAITTVAGAVLIGAREHLPLLTALDPFLKGVTLLFWSVGTWWVPLLAVLTAWRHLVRRHPLSYEPQLWSMVFPLGMYAVATFRLSQVLALPFLVPLAHAFLWVAVAAWCLVAVGLARTVVLGWRRHTRSTAPSLGA